ncbi:hypothetical protein DL93DRAFT_159632 [Clavulina sp. PMI_390]|nr:hypothetical protein DL93DRAFT_159632 [Clavulina sp. PMI_390]
MSHRVESLALPNLRSIIISSAPRYRSEPTHHRWTLPMELVTNMVDARRGILKRVVFPYGFDHTGGQPSIGKVYRGKGVGAELVETAPLTVEQLHRLQGSEPGRIIEIGYKWPIDDHGFDMEPPDWV